MKLLKLQASWCNPCKVLSNTLKNCNLGIEVQEIDIDDNPEITSKYKVRGVPTMIIVDDEGNTVSTLVGVKTKEEIENWVSSNI